MSRVLKFRAFLNGQMSRPFNLGEGVCWPDGRVSTANKVGEVMQFTGLIDKSGKEVFDGDVFKCKGGDVGQIKHQDGCFYYFGCEQLMLSSVHSIGDVIGNIHEHPELLEQR